MKLIMVMVMGVVLAGCATWKSTPVISKVENEYVSIELKPEFEDPYNNRAYGFNSFLLTVNNKTDKNIDIIWNKTNFIMDGMSNGGFVFASTMIKDKDLIQRQQDVIFAKSRLIKSIYPASLVHPSRGAVSMPVGENGVYVTLNVSGKEVQEKVTTIITHDSLK